MALWDFARGDLAVAGKALLLADALLNGPGGVSPARPGPWAAPDGICGVGVLLSPTGLVPFILVDGGPAAPSSPPTPQPLLPFLTNMKLVPTLFPGDFLLDVMVLVVSTPELNAAPGEPVVVGTLLGTLGAQVQWLSGKGFVTAGHVAQQAGMGAALGNPPQPGTVEVSLDPQNSGGQLSADVAVLSVKTPLPTPGRFIGPSLANPADMIAIQTVTGGPGGRSAKVIAMTKWLHVGSANATCAEVYLTDQCVTVKSDSGAPAVLRGAPEIVGHVVGASPGCTTYLQDAAFQFKVLRTHPNFGLLSL